MAHEDDRELALALWSGQVGQEREAITRYLQCISNDARIVFNGETDIAGLGQALTSLTRSRLPGLAAEAAEAGGGCAWFDGCVEAIALGWVAGSGAVGAGGEELDELSHAARMPAASAGLPVIAARRRSASRRPMSPS